MRHGKLDESGEIVSVPDPVERVQKAGVFWHVQERIVDEAVAFTEAVERDGGSGTAPTARRGSA
ncbi:MAG: hypothetical protein ACYDA8_03000 [Deferrisomatales bacterium]